jgi:hypothetical protein
MTSQEIQRLREQLATAKKKAIQASEDLDAAGPLDLYNGTWEEVENIQAKLNAAEKEEAEREEREKRPVETIKIEEDSANAELAAMNSNATATRPSQPHVNLSMVAAMTSRQLQEKLAAARKELRKVEEEGRPTSEYIEARNKVELIRSKFKIAEKEETKRVERIGKAAARIKVKKSESAEPEIKPGIQTKIERDSSAGRIKAESSDAQGVQLPLRQYLHTSKADAAALKLQKAKDAYEDAVAGPAGHPTPKQLIIDLDEDARRTFLNFNGMRRQGEGWEIWNFRASRWVLWDVNGDRDHACWLLWEYAKKVLCVIYFCTHQCRSKDVELYIPKRFYLQLYTPTMWAFELNERRSKLHGQVLTMQVQRNIVPRWKDNYGHPVTPYDAENDTEAAKADRITFFEKQAAKDEIALQYFVGGIGDSIDWEQIAKKETDEDVAAWRWAVKSLAKAANLVHELGTDEDQAQSGQRQFSRLRNKFWEMFPADQGDKVPHHSTIAIRHHLGRYEAPTRVHKRKRELEEFEDSSIGKLRQRFESKGKAFVDLTSDDEMVDIDF